MHELLKIGSRISILPVIHGSVESALQVRKLLLSETFSCVAVPLPESFQEKVEQGIGLLPTPTIAIQRESKDYASGSPVADFTAADDAETPADRVSYVPIDPCQPVIAGLRIAMGEHVPRAFIDLETASFLPFTGSLPDAYALKKMPLARFAAAVLPFLPRPAEQQTVDRIRYMAQRLRELAARHSSVLFLCSLMDWPWIREAYVEQAAPGAEHDFVEAVELAQPDPRTLLFMLGELPYVTALYERARSQLDDDEHLSIDGIKELLITAREAYLADFRNRARPITTQTFATCLKYLRNLTLLDRRLTPCFYNIVMAAKQVAGDSFAYHVAETARHYATHDFSGAADTGLPFVSLGIDRIRQVSGDIAHAVSRLPGPPVEWRSCELRRRPPRNRQRQWQIKWNPFGQCSWPPEDELIENFRAHVADRAQAIMGIDLAKTEKFTTSIRDGIDIRDTLRSWHTGDIFVKVIPPSQGTLDAVVMLFNSPADPRDYPWRTTWFAEHENESTLAFFATDFMSEMVGPGIGLATYGGALFLYPPIAIHDIWHDPRLEFTETLEERLLAAACLHSKSSRVALLSAYPPGPGWRRLARRFRKKWVHVPLTQFSLATIQQLRMVHVLNGKEVRSFAAHFIRKA